MAKEVNNYRGTQPAILVNVLEGEGTPESPNQIVQYVLSIQDVAGIGRPVTIGKVVELTKEEKEAFTKTT